MKTIRICLMTKDPEYGTALSRSLQLQCKFFSIQMEEKRQENQGNELEKDEYDIFLTDDMNLSAKKTVYLSEDPASAWIEPQSESFVIYKYQHVGNISTVLRLAHSVYSQTEMLSDETEQVNIISISASSGGVGCTSVALGICQELTRFHGKKVLYVSLEEFESTAIYFPSSNVESTNISRFLYSILNDKNAARWVADGYMQKEQYGISAFHPAKGRNPLRELSGCEFVKFINHVTKDKVYTDIVLDCGNGLDGSIVSAFELSNWVFHISGKNPDSSRKEAYLRTVAHRAGRIDSFRTSDVHNFYEEAELDGLEMNKEMENEQLVIEEDPTSFMEINGHRIISLDKTFGQGIRQIVCCLTETSV